MFPFFVMRHRAPRFRRATMVMAILVAPTFFSAGFLLGSLLVVKAQLLHLCSPRCNSLENTTLYTLTQHYTLRTTDHDIT